MFAKLNAHNTTGGCKGDTPEEHRNTLHRDPLIVSVLSSGSVFRATIHAMCSRRRAAEANLCRLVHLYTGLPLAVIIGSLKIRSFEWSGFSSYFKNYGPFELQGDENIANRPLFWLHLRRIALVLSCILMLLLPTSKLPLALMVH